MNTAFEHATPGQHLAVFPKLYEIASALGVVKEWADYLDQGILRENHFEYLQSSLEGAERLAVEVAVDARSTVLNDFATWMVDEIKTAEVAVRAAVLAKAEED